jgi:hypothetical protein
VRTSTISPYSKRSYIHAVAELGADDPAFHFVRDTCRSSGRLAVTAYHSLRWGRGLRRKALTRKRLLAEALGLLDRDDLLQGIAQQMEVIEVALLAIFRPMEITLAAH